MADPFKAENDDEWSQWFDALHEYHKAKVIKAVTGASNEFSLRDGAASQNSNITLLPHRFFNEGRGLFKSGQWDFAIKSFQECLKCNPHDKLSETYIERCQIMKKANPSDWDGVWVMTSK